MKRQVTYLMTGQSQLPYLIVSLWSLRRWYDGPIQVYVWPESYEIVRRISGDRNLRVEAVLRKPDQKPAKWKKWQFLDKIHLHMQLDCDVSLYLDADTMVNNDVGELFEAAVDCGFVATQFSGWTTQGRIIRGRVAHLRQFPEIDQEMVERTLAEVWPSPNGGVWACRPGSPVLPVWHRWTEAAMSVFIPDEKVLHVLQPRFCFEEMTTLCGNGRYNCSPKFRPVNLPHERVAVYHFHGSSNVRPQKSKAGLELWWPLYKECLKKNVGGLAEWRKDVRNKWMDLLEGNGP